MGVAVAWEEMLDIWKGYDSLLLPPNPPSLPLPLLTDLALTVQVSGGEGRCSLREALCSTTEHYQYVPAFSLLP